VTERSIRLRSPALVFRPGRSLVAFSTRTSASRITRSMSVRSTAVLRAPNRAWIRRRRRALDGTLLHPLSRDPWGKKPPAGRGGTQHARRLLPVTLTAHTPRRLIDVGVRLDGSSTSMEGATVLVPLGAEWWAESIEQPADRDIVAVYEVDAQALSEPMAASRSRVRYRCRWPGNPTTKSSRSSTFPRYRNRRSLYVSPGRWFYECRWPTTMRRSRWSG
jgi:hypothetical protein